MKHFDFLTGDLARDRRNVDLLLGAVEQMHGGRTRAEVLESAVDSAIELTGGERGVLLLSDGRGDLGVRVARGRGGHDLPLDLRYSTTVARKVMSTGRPVLAAPSVSESISTGHLRSTLAVPLPGREHPIGVLYVDSAHQGPPFTPGDLAVFEALAGLVVSAIERDESERRRRDLEAAREIQLRMAPRQVPAIPGYDVAFEGRATEETSGDYHDVIPLSDGTVCLAVGDVSGHGLPAALYMTSVRAALRTFLHAGRRPHAVLSDLNAYVLVEMGPGHFVTLFLGIVDPRARTLRWASAGHRSVHWQPRSGVTELNHTGPPLGVLPDVVYGEGGPVSLDDGDAVVLYTDGIHEAKNGARDLYGEDRFLASVAAHAARGPLAGSLLDGVLRDLSAHVGAEPLEDDVTCVVLRVLPGA